MFRQVAFNGITVKAPKVHAASFGSISQIYAFGDSYSDNGAALQISTNAVNAGVSDSTLLPADPALGLYDVGGRWTNGSTAVEVLARNLQLNLTDYAVGGAKSGNGNYHTWLDPYQNTGVFGQIDQYKAGLQGQTADKNALYIIFASGNDYFQYNDFNQPGTITQLSAQGVSNIEEDVSKLAALGAKQFLVVNSLNLAIVPAIVDENKVDQATEFRDSFNTLLRSRLNALSQQLGVEIAEYDYTGISNLIRSKPGDYGLINVNDPCQPTFPEIKPACSTPDQYYFWDEYHPTRRTHEIIGEDMTKFVVSQQVK